MAFPQLAGWCIPQLRGVGCFNVGLPALLVHLIMGLGFPAICELKILCKLLVAVIPILALLWMQWQSCMWKHSSEPWLSTSTHCSASKSITFILCVVFHLVVEYCLYHTMPARGQVSISKVRFFLLPEIHLLMFESYFFLQIDLITEMAVCILTMCSVLPLWVGGFSCPWANTRVALMVQSVACLFQHPISGNGQCRENARNITRPVNG